MDFIDAFYKKVEQMNINWNVKALVTEDDKYVSLGDDTKLIGRIFELLCHPILQEIAQENGYTLEVSAKQNYYPDFTLSKYDKDGNVTNERIAVDIKTTYREKGKIEYTLGSYASFIRDGKKNISHPYAEYVKHYVIGFVYSRGNSEQGIVYDKIEDIKVPYSKVEFFVQEKYKISGDVPGSGNTENMGSFPTTDIELIREGNGPFSVLGYTIFEDYWKNYPRYKTPEDEKEYTSLPAYFEWKAACGNNMADLKIKYEYWRKMYNPTEKEFVEKRLEENPTATLFVNTKGKNLAVLLGNVDDENAMFIINEEIIREIISMAEQSKIFLETVEMTQSSFMDYNKKMRTKCKTDSEKGEM
ncbi:MAG: hypothetical protein IJ282_08590 [Lachnospiraceae bacterium]|nr:hypothetical protein [Lachnospiraceae bacterium]